MSTGSLNLFPTRIPIGQVVLADGSRGDVLMSLEFSRALSDLFFRVGGANGLGNEDLALLALQADASVADELARSGITSLELAMPADPSAQIAALAQRLDDVVAMLEPSSEVDRLCQQLADTEQLAGFQEPVRVDWERPGQIGALTANTASVTTLTATDATDATNSTTAPVKTAGGLAVAKKAIIGTLLDLSTATAGQIKFPAAQNASANANTLDDYEEGTWVVTPVNLTVVNGTGGATYAGKYTKIGNLVFFAISITVTGTCTTASVANTTLFNLPFVPAYASVCGAVDANVVSLGNGQIWTDGNTYSPTWAARNVPVDIGGVYAV